MRRGYSAEITWTRCPNRLARRATAKTPGVSTRMAERRFIIFASIRNPEPRRRSRSWQKRCAPPQSGRGSALRWSLGRSSMSSTDLVYSRLVAARLHRACPPYRETVWPRTSRPCLDIRCERCSEYPKSLRAGYTPVNGRRRGSMGRRNHEIIVVESLPGERSYPPFARQLPKPARSRLLRRRTVQAEPTSSGWITWRSPLPPIHQKAVACARISWSDYPKSLPRNRLQQ